MYIAIAIAVLVLGYGALRIGVRAASPRPTDLGVTDGRLKPCPDSPNCVSTQGNRRSNTVDPFPYSGDLDVVRNALVDMIEGFPRTQIVTAEGAYIHAEFSSAGMGFLDDVEFYIDESAGLVHFRSGSRIGYDDIGANKARYKMIRDTLMGQVESVDSQLIFQ